MIPHKKDFNGESCEINSGLLIILLFALGKLLIDRA